MKNIFYKSDIKIIEGYPGTDDFVYHYFTQKGRETYDVSLAAGNCRVYDDENGEKKMVISLDSHGLNPGQLKVLREMNFTDDDFTDGEYNKKVESWYDVKLVNGRSDDDEPIEYEGIFTAMRGEAGKDADTDAIVQYVTQEIGKVNADVLAVQNAVVSVREDVENVRTYVDASDEKVLADAKEYFDTHSAKVEMENVLYFETTADFENAKADIAEKSIVYIAETDETMVYKPQKYNAKFVVSEEWVHDAAFISSEVLGGSIDLTGKVMLTMVLHHFESFVVNGTEMVKGNETADGNGMCPLIMDANLGDEFEVVFRFKENNEFDFIGGEFLLAGFALTPITELILREHDFTAYGANSAKVFEAYHMAWNVSLHKISICTSQKFGAMENEMDSVGLFAHRINFAELMTDGLWRTTPPPSDAYVELSDNDAFGQEFVDGSSETDFGLLTAMTSPKSFVASQLGIPEENVYDVELRRIPYVND